MRARNGTEDAGDRLGGLLSVRMLAGLLLVLLVVLFVALNREETEISFIVFDSTTSLWVALALAAAAGFLAGFLFGRRHYRR
jgi:uncharacterized integral membrane protein